MLSYLARRALTAALVAAAGAAGTMAARRYFERRSQRPVHRDERTALNRWENEGGAPVVAPTATALERGGGASPL